MNKTFENLNKSYRVNQSVNYVELYQLTCHKVQNAPCITMHNYYVGQMLLPVKPSDSLQTRANSQKYWAFFLK